jgi:hypothetical protein
MTQYVSESAMEESSGPGPHQQFLIFTFDATEVNPHTGEKE